MQNIVIGITGGSGSGKTYLTKKISKFATWETRTISLDSYYKNLPHLSMEEKAAFNYDHPDSIDRQLLVKDLDAIIANQPITPPLYDFNTSSRVGIEDTIRPTRIIFLEGLFLLCMNEVYSRLALTVFLESDEHIRFKRRLLRDVNERGRSIESILKKMNTFVIPMHNLYIEPYKQKADIIIYNNNGNIKLEARRIADLITKRFLTTAKEKSESVVLEASP